MISKKLMNKKLLVAPVAGAILGAGILVGCAIDTKAETPDDPNPITVSVGLSELSGGEHGGRPEGRGGGEYGFGVEGTEGIGVERSGEIRGSEGTEGPESGGGSEEASGSMLAPNETFDMTRAGARLIMNYDVASNAFTGTVENTTDNTLTNVRIEVHLSNGAELGPTTPVDMAPGEVIAINLPSTPESFTGWTPHAEVGSGEGGGEQAGGESGPDGPEGPESGSEAAREAAMSSPITPLDQTWNGVLGGLAISRSLRRGNPVRPHDGAEHDLADAVLRADRTAPEVRDANGGRAWPGGDGRPGPRTAGDLDPAGLG